jgi:hypothetical protein
MDKVSALPFLGRFPLMAKRKRLFPAPALMVAPESIATCPVACPVPALSGGHRLWMLPMTQPVLRL